MKVIDPYINDMRIRNLEHKISALFKKIEALEQVLSTEGEESGQEDKSTDGGKKKRNRERSQAKIDYV